MVARQPGVIMSISKAIYELGGDIVSLGTSAGDTSETAELTFKVAGVEKEALIRWISPHIEKLVDVR
jgi:acetolactate synthase small subunit